MKFNVGSVALAEYVSEDEKMEIDSMFIEEL